MATITLKDEATREVLVRAMWNMAVEAALGSAENYEVWADDPDDQFRANRVEIEARVINYNGWREEMHTVQDASLGDSVSVPLEAFGDMILGFREGLAHCPEHLLNASPEERKRMLELFDAAYPLLPAEAVA
jgi:hypothetical protein